MRGPVVRWDGAPMGTRATVAVVCGAIAIVLVDVVSLATSDHAYQSAATLAANIVTGSVYVVTGLIAARKRPESRVGLLLGIAGLLYLAAMLNQSNVALIYTIGWLPYWIAMAVIGHIIITFPSGRIRAWTEGVIVGSNYVNGIVLTFVSLLFWSERVTFGCTTCPSNLLMVSNDSALADRIGGLATWLGVATAVASVGILTYRWWRATLAGRRVYGPALWVGLVLTVEYILVVGFFQDWLSPTSRFFWVDQALTAAYPIAFLVGFASNAHDPFGHGRPGDRARSRNDACRWPAGCSRRAVGRSIASARVRGGRGRRLGRRRRTPDRAAVGGIR